MRSVRSAALLLAAASTLACGDAREVDRSALSGDCTSCHAFPPASGAHAAHVVAGTYSSAIACGACHEAPTAASRNHPDGRVEVRFGAMAVQDVPSPGYAGNGGTCAVYCHGSTPLLGGTTSPPWTSTAGVACGDCHAVAPTSGLHQFHRNRGVATCGDCHGPAYSAPYVDLAVHVNGAADAVSCLACHEDGVPQ
jgi:predicted CxxxxCH...CXXCH cytochrome family protein